ncbi:sugar ABC transporter ATP-binding protein [Falsihalocynthiibacter arcticus]|uniref:sugar ABC transporter ATP-binding protein n=1 Tax=Falsihalocynthiibacter arcticus TaxID=1579316 RepID=UPI003001D9C7
MSRSEPLFQLNRITKSYGGVHALNDADLTIHAGRIHAILGENGAGKSTLIKSISGVVAPDSGEILMNGKPVSFSSPGAANQAGIVCVFQELSLMPDLTVAENIVANNPPTRFGMIDGRRQREIAVAALAKAGGGDIHPMARVGDLPLSRRQIVEIAKALSQNPKLLILDEATSALTSTDVRIVMDVLKRLRDEGMALLYISHRMHEIEELADDCTVFRNGSSIATYKQGTKTDTEVVEMMIGREVINVFPPKVPFKGRDEKFALEVRDLSWNDILHDISLGIRPGEIMGLGGLDGQGQRELLLGLFGILKGATGTILVDGTARKIDSPGAAMSDDVNIALVPEDRKTEGLMLPMSVSENLTFASLGDVSRLGVLNASQERKKAEEMKSLLSIKAVDMNIPVGTLSGGNQQKVVIAKWLLRNPKIILFNDPTRGIDVGTKQEIYKLLRDLADRGTAVVLYSTDYDELIGCCDRVAVMYAGEIKALLAGDEITEMALLGGALNIEPTLKKTGQMDAELMQ